MTQVTLQHYKVAELELAETEGRKAMLGHALVTVFVWAVVVPINIWVASEFPWSLFVIAGTGIGLMFHWFGYRRTAEDTAEHQQAVYERAQAL